MIDICQHCGWAKEGAFCPNTDCPSKGPDSGPTHCSRDPYYASYANTVDKLVRLLKRAEVVCVKANSPQSTRLAKEILAALQAVREGRE